MTARPTVLVVTYNAAGDIRGCLAGVGGLRVVVVDNASQDETPGILSELHAQGTITDLVLGDSNLGFARAVNVGLRLIGDGDVLLLNPDATIDGANIGELRRIADDERIGIVAPLIDNGPGVTALQAGAQPRLWAMFTHFSGLARFFPHARWLRGRYLYRESLEAPLTDAGWVSGGCLYFTARARAVAGELSERWFMYGEDVDLCRRVTEAGLRVVVARDVHAFHSIGGSVNSEGGPVSTMWAVNTLDYYRQTFSNNPLAVFAWRLIFSTGLVLRSVLLSIRAARSSDPGPIRARAKRFRVFATAVWRPTPAP